MVDRPDEFDVSSFPDELEPWRDGSSADAPADASLWPVVEQTLAERELTYDATGEHGALVRVRGLATTYDVALTTLEELGVLCSSLALHLYVGEPLRASTLDLLNRISHGELLLGGFEIEPESGGYNGGRRSTRRAGCWCPEWCTTA